MIKQVKIIEEETRIIVNLGCRCKSVEKQEFIKHLQKHKLLGSNRTNAYKKINLLIREGWIIQKKKIYGRGRPKWVVFVDPLIFDKIHAWLNIIQASAWAVQQKPEKDRYRGFND